MPCSISWYFGHRYVAQSSLKLALSLQINVLQWFPITTSILLPHYLQFVRKEDCRMLHGNLNLAVAFRTKIKNKKKCCGCFVFLSQAAGTRKGKRLSSLKRSNLHQRDVKLTLIHHSPSCFFFHFSTQLRQTEINRKSRKRLENKLFVKCSRLNFYFKGTLWNRVSGSRYTSHKNFEAWVFGCEAANWGEESEGGCWQLRWRIRGQKHYRWMGQIGVLLLTQPDTGTERLNLVQRSSFWLFVQQQGLRVFSLLFWQLYNE